jgi:hypothetical protein
MFTSDFKSLLFKSFIQSKFDYCSSIFINEIYIKTDSKLIKCFDSSIKRLLNVNFRGELIEKKLSSMVERGFLAPFWKRSGAEP